jgi:hypothetical protein
MEFEKVTKGFKQGAMFKFNRDYPCVGLPSGGKYVFDNDDKAFLQANGIPASVYGPYEVKLSSIPAGANPYNYAYGYGAYKEPAPGVVICDNGLGVAKDKTNPTAIQYYSFTGNGAWNTNMNSYGWDPDPFDWALLLFNAFHVVVGEDINDLPDPIKNITLEKLDSFNYVLEEMFRWRVLSDWSNICDAIDGLLVLDELGEIADGLDEALGTYGYIRPTDSFIPVDSAHFGKYTGTYYWNHADEQNHFLEWGVGASDPKVIYANHVNMLKNAGL